MTVTQVFFPQQKEWNKGAFGKWAPLSDSDLEGTLYALLSLDKTRKEQRPVQL